MENFKFSSYGFMYFESPDNKDEFYNETKNKKFRLKVNISVQFLPVKRNRTEHHYKHVICQFIFKKTSKHK